MRARARVCVVCCVCVCVRACVLFHTKRLLNYTDGVGEMSLKPTRLVEGGLHTANGFASVGD